MFVKKRKIQRKINHYQSLDLTIRPLVLFKKNIDHVATETQGAWVSWNAPKVSLKPATVVVSFWQKMLLGEHWLVKKEGLWLSSRVMKWKTKIPRLAHANGCGSPLAALLEDSRHFWTCFWKGLSSQWLVFLHLLASFLPVVGRVRMRREGDASGPGPSVPGRTSPLASMKWSRFHLGLSHFLWPT